MLVLSEDQVRQVLTIEACLEANRTALQSLSESSTSMIAVVPTRIGIPYKGVDGNDDWTLFKPASYVKKHCNDDHDADAGANDSNDDLTLFMPASYEYRNRSGNRSGKASPNATPPSNRNAAETAVLEVDNDTETDDTTSNHLLGAKVVSVRAKNSSRNKSTVNSTVLLLDAQTGDTLAFMKSDYLTAIRTAAGSAIATELCLSHRRRCFDSTFTMSSCTTDTDTSTNAAASPSSSLPLLHLVVFGAGDQAELHIKCISFVLKTVAKVTIVNRSLGRARKLKELLELYYSTNNTRRPQEHEDSCCVEQEINCIELNDTDNVKNVVQDADVIVTATNTRTPLFDFSFVKKGCHINGVGSYTPNMDEVGSSFIRNRCLTVIDTMEALDVGDLTHLQASSPNYVGLVGNLLDGSVEMEEYYLRDDEYDCTFFKSVGTAIQDLLTASEVFQRAKELGIGTIVNM
jgi:ornithine cyclodeaminase